MLATVDGHDEVIRLAGVFMQYYRENARWLERTYDFVPRVGLDELKAILVDDRDGIVAGLEERMQSAIDAYRDPWQDGREPSGPGQFANNLPLLPLPIVPVGRAPDGSLQASSAGRGPAASGPFAGGAGTVSDYSEEGGAGMTTSEITEHAVAAADDLPPGGARAYAVGDTMVAVFRLRSGELRAVDAVCPHSGGPLADGQFDAKKVICPLHNYFFSLADGTCLNGDYAVRTYPVREEAARSSSTRSGTPQDARALRRGRGPCEVHAQSARSADRTLEALSGRGVVDAHELPVARALDVVARDGRAAGALLQSDGLRAAAREVVVGERHVLNVLECDSLGRGVALEVVAGDRPVRALAHAVALAVAVVVVRALEPSGTGGTARSRTCCSGS